MRRIKALGMKFTFPGFILSILILQPVYTLAQLEDSLEFENYQLEGTTITALRQKIGFLEDPGCISILDEKRLEITRPRSLPEGLIGTAGVWIQKTNHGGGSAFLRGFTGNQTLLMIDGIRVNNSTYRYGPNQYLNTIDPLSIGRVEVLRGSGSVQYGSDALGGVIQMLTIDPMFGEEGLKSGGRVYGKYMSAGMEKTTRAEASMNNSFFTAIGGVSYKDFGDLIAGGNLGVEAPSGYKEWDADLKLKVRLGKRGLLTGLHHNSHQSEVDRFDQVSQRGYKTYMFDPQFRELSYLKFETATGKSIFSRLNFTLSRQRSFERRVKQKIADEFLKYESDEVNTLGFVNEITSLISDQGTAVSGFEIYIDKIYSNALSVNETNKEQIQQRGLYPDGSKVLNYGLFSLHTYQCNHWILTGGVRLNSVLLEARDDEFGNLRVNPTSLAGNLSVSYPVSSSSRLIGSVNSGFRAPNINDLSSFGLFDSGVEVPNSNLSPEKSLSGELSWKYASSKTGIILSTYYTSLANLIARVPAMYNGSDIYQGEKVYTRQNIKKAMITGIESRWRQSIYENIEMIFNLTYTFGKSRDDHQPLRRIPPLFGSYSVRFQPWGSLKIRGECLFAAAQRRLSPGDKSDHRIAESGTPGWMVFNLYAEYQFHWLHLNLGANNLLNHAYRMHGSGVDGVGRSIWTGIEIVL